VSDLGRELSFASFLFPEPAAGPGLVHQGELAEELGFDIVAVPDHIDWPHRVEQWTILSAVAARTRRIKLLPAVSALIVRPPAVLAKAAWSLELIAPGRLILGIGTGALPTMRTIGERPWTGREAVDRLREGMEVMRLLWKGEPKVSYTGTYYTLDEATPPPPHQRKIDIWIGANRPAMRRLIAQSADGWFPGYNLFEPEDLRPAVQHLDDEILAAGRRLTDVRRVFNAIGRKIQPASEGFLIGPPEQWVDELTRVVLEFGFDTILYGDRDATVEQLHVFAERVIPGVKANVAGARAGAPAARTA
jgi:alkanesulfonate monooxygenase SsuD/methylene tetrahydromethanopterin reductase-like flavin-dependent oxidoreductase (luciferase family)